MAPLSTGNEWLSIKDGGRAGDNNREAASSLGRADVIGVGFAVLAGCSEAGLECRRDADRVKGDCDRGGVLGTTGVLARAGDNISDDEI